MKTILNKMNIFGRENLLMVSMMMFIVSLFLPNNLLFIVSYPLVLIVLLLNMKNEIYGDISLEELSDIFNEEAEECFEAGLVFEGFLKTITIPLIFLTLIGITSSAVIVLIL